MNLKDIPEIIQGKCSFCKHGFLFANVHTLDENHNPVFLNVCHHSVCKKKLDELMPAIRSGSDFYFKNIYPGPTATK